MKRLAPSIIALFFLAACGGGGGSDAAQDSKEKAPQEEKAKESKKKESKSQSKEVELTLNTIGETMNEMAYEPKRLEVPAGATVKLTLVNKAEAKAMIHNAVFIERGAQEEVSTAGIDAGAENDFIPENDKIIAATELADPGETVELTFTAPSEPGTYQYICTYPGHTAMKGILLVK